MNTDENWSIQDYIDDLESQLDDINETGGISDRDELVDLITDLQVDDKEPIPGVVDYFSNRYGLR